MGGGGGGGGGGPACIFCETCLANKLGSVTKLLRGVPDGGPQPPTSARGTATPIFGPFLAKLCQITETYPKPKFWVLYL